MKKGGTIRNVKPIVHNFTSNAESLAVTRRIVEGRASLAV